RGGPRIRRRGWRGRRAPRRPPRARWPGGRPPGCSRTRIPTRPDGRDFAGDAWRIIRPAGCVRSRWAIDSGMSLHMALPELVLALLALVANPFVGALLVAIAVIAIAAELKAGASGLGILVSFVSMGLFFAASVTMGLGGWVEVLLALLGSLALAVEVFLLPGFGVAGVLGVAL